MASRPLPRNGVYGIARGLGLLQESSQGSWIAFERGNASLGFCRVEGMGSERLPAHSESPKPQQLYRACRIISPFPYSPDPQSIRREEERSLSSQKNQHISNPRYCKASEPDPGMLHQ